MKISDEAFEALLSYIEPLKGRSKDETIKAAEKIVQDVEEDENSHGNNQDLSKESVILFPSHPASFAHNFVSGMQSFYFSESEDAIVLQTCH